MVHAARIAAKTSSAPKWLATSRWERRRRSDNGRCMCPSVASSPSGDGNDKLPASRGEYPGAGGRAAGLEAAAGATLSLPCPKVSSSAVTAYDLAILAHSAAQERHASAQRRI